MKWVAVPAKRLCIDPFHKTIIFILLMPLFLEKGTFTF